jgi:hypothetical protein
MHASQLWYTETVHSARTQVLHLFTYQRLAKCSKILPNIILVLIEQNGCFATLVPRNSAFRRETSFAYFYMPKVSEMLWNTPKHHFGSNGVEWMLRNFGARIVHGGANTSFASFYMPNVSEMFWNTPKYHFGSNGVEWTLRNFGTPK